MEVELLAPAGSVESLKAAINAGADAVYVGGTQFSARAYANNLNTEEMLKAIDFCHLHGRKLYLAVNTLLKEQELTNELYDYLLPFYKRGLDAVILQDIGALAYIQEAFPDLDIHASTQMTVTSAKGSLFLKNLGVSRVVTARELSLKEIKEIKKTVDIEIESFVHGALCYCYSGQCLFSSLIGGRSGNRGRCAQPCRLPYDLSHGKQKLNSKNERYLLSPKDICTLEILPDIIQAGVYSLKIEGRMKRPEYTAGVVGIYRKYIDYYLNHKKEPYLVSKEDMQTLMELYNRGGFTEGYYNNQNGREMISLNRPNHLGVPAVRIKKMQKGSLILQALTDLYKKDALDVDEYVPGKRKEFLIPDEIKSGQIFHIDNFPANTLYPGQILHRVRCEKLLEQLRKDYIQIDLKEKINGKLMISVGKPVILTIIWGIFCIQEEGDIPQPALKQPLSIETIKKQMLKTGGTAFQFESLNIKMEDSCFLPLQSLNNLRRNALQKLEQNILMARRREAVQQKPLDTINAVASLNHMTAFKTSTSMENAKLLHPMAAAESINEQVYKIQVSIENINMLEELLKIQQIFGIYLDCNALSLPLEKEQTEHFVQICHNYHKKCYYIMPHILRNSTLQSYKDSKEVLQLFDGILIKNVEAFQFLQDIEYNRHIILDHSIYTYNRKARLFFRTKGIAYDTVPLELNAKEVKARSCQNSEMLVYGHLPMMVTAGCLQKTIEGCNKKSKLLTLKDRKGIDFPVKSYCDLCYNLIYNSKPLVLLDQKKEIDRLQPEYLRLNFTIEPTDEAVKITKQFIKKFILDEKGTSPQYDHFNSFTRGHFKRGIE